MKLNCVALFVIILYLNSNINAVTITQDGNCKAILDDGKIIDLKPLDDPNSPMSTVSDDITFQYNPCTNFACGTSTASICEKSYFNPYPFAQADNVVMTMPADNLVLTYEGQIVINCICAEDQTKKLEINSVDNVIFFQLKLSDSHCCAKSPSPDKPSSGGLSGGGIILIIFFSLAAVYLIVGVIYQAKVKKATGLDMIPNRKLWSGIPRNILDGFSFVIQKLCRGGSNAYNQL